MLLLDFVIGILAVFRLSSLLTYEKGPLDVFIRWRRFVGITHDDAGLPIEWPETFLAGLTSCVWCNSVWIGGFWSVAYLISRDVTVFGSLFLALSSGAVIVNRWIRG